MVQASAKSGIPLRQFGNTDARISALGMGGHHLGDAPDEATAVRMVHEAVDGGITFFDNCWEYHRGKSEIWMGKGLKGSARQSFPDDQGLHPRPGRRPRACRCWSSRCTASRPTTSTSGRSTASPSTTIRSCSSGPTARRRPSEGQRAGQGAVRRVYRPQGPGHSPEDAGHRLSRSTPYRCR